MLDGRPWTDLLTTVESFNDIAGINAAIQQYPNIKPLEEFDIRNVKEIYIPHGDNNITYKNVEEERYTSGYFILSDGVNVQIRICNDMFIPIFTSIKDKSVLLGVRFKFGDGLISCAIDTCSPFGIQGYYQKVMQVDIYSFKDEMDPEDFQAFKQAFDDNFKDGYNKYYPLPSTDQTS